MRNPFKFAVISLAFFLTLPLQAQDIPTPESVLGFVPGTDRKLVEWPILVDYYRQLAAASDRVQFRELGKTTLGAPFVALVISSAANMAHLSEIRAMNAKLADPRTLTSAQEKQTILANGKTIVLITSSIHSTEVGGHLTPTLIAYRLASEDTPEVREILDNTVVLLVPSLNPDGVTIVAHWYNQTLGTPAEGTGPPELYHHYVGHDNNRDWYAFTQVETQYTIDSLYSVWHPQIVHDIHQQGSNGSRFFLPPFLDPVEPNVDPLLVEGFTTLGTFMAWELAGQGKKGIVKSSTYDAWTPARAYMHHHGGVRVLSETASARLATPIEVPFESLRGRRGFDAQKSSWNFTDPWPGGKWTLANILDYQTSGAFALLEHAARNRQVWLSNFVRVGERAVRGWKGWPYAYVIPRDDQNPTSLATVLGIMQRGQVEVRTAEQPFSIDGVQYHPGTYVIVLKQPYASFAKALLERQDYPDLRIYPGGPPKPPYDVTAHTLPLLMGVDVALAKDSIRVGLSDPVSVAPPNTRYAGLSRDSGKPRIGLYKSYTASMDEGWTRWIFDTWHVRYESLHNSDMRRKNLAKQYDAIIVPDMSEQAILSGLPASRYPAEYAGGLKGEGSEALKQFVQDGGTAIFFNAATAFAIDLFELPVRNVLAQLKPQEFYAPGTIFRLLLDRDHPLTRNMPAQTIAWFQRSPAFDVSDTRSIDVVGRYPDNPEDVLLSGWVLGPERVAGRAALIDASVGKGHVILFGFKPQYRAQTLATFPLVFNAVQPNK